MRSSNDGLSWTANLSSLDNAEKAVRQYSSLEVAQRPPSFLCGQAHDLSQPPLGRRELHLADLQLSPGIRRR